MNTNLDTIAQDLYGKISVRFDNIKIGDETGEVLSKKTDIPKARFFEFEYKEHGDDLGTITITLDEDDGIIVQVSGKLEDANHKGAFKLIRGLRMFAKDRLLKFDVQNIGKDQLDQRDYEFQSKPKEENMAPMMESKMYGTSKISYQDLGEAKLIVKHSQPVNIDLAAGRTMHIESIYIENAQGERFKYPVKHLNGARAMAEHLVHGGIPYDPIGKHIVSLSEELSQLRKFKGYVGRNESLAEAMGDITSKVMERIEEVKKEVNMLQRSGYYKQFAESFVDKEEQMIPEEIMSDWIDRLTIRTFNEDLRTTFPYIFKLVDESEVPVKELTADDLLENASDKDLGDGFSLTQLDMFGGVPAVLDTQSNTYVIPNKRPNGGGAIIRSMAPYILIKDGQSETAMKVGPATMQALQKAGLGGSAPSADNQSTLTPKSSPMPTQEEMAFEEFMNGLMNEDNADLGPNDKDWGEGIFDADPKEALKELNKLFEKDLTPGVGGANLEILKKLIPDEAFIAKINEITDVTKDSSDEPINQTIKVAMHEVAQNNENLAKILNLGLIDFDGTGEVGGEETPDTSAEAGATPPPAPDASTPPPIPPAPDAGATPPPAPGATPPEAGAQPTPPPVAESSELSRWLKIAGLNEGMNGSNANNSATSGNPVRTPDVKATPLAPMPPETGAGAQKSFPNAKLIKAIHKAVECGAGPDTMLDFGHKKQTLLSCIEECGMDPQAFGMEKGVSGAEQMLKDISGFWNHEKKNFTIGGTRAKIKVLKGYKDGEYPDATDEDVASVLHMINHVDPSSGHDEVTHIKHLAQGHESNMGEESEDDTDFDNMMSQFMAKHQGVDPQSMLDKFVQDHPDAQVTRNSTSSGTIDGKPASYDDAMSKFKDISGNVGKNLGMPDADFSNPQGMMKGIQDKMGGMMKNMPNQKIDFPGGSMNPQDMMKGIMSKMPSGAGNMPDLSSMMREDAELTAMLKIAGLR